MASQITSLTIVYSTVYSSPDQRKHQSSASLAFVREIHRWLVNSPHNGPVTRKGFNLMTSSWHFRCSQLKTDICVRCAWYSLKAPAVINSTLLTHSILKDKNAICMYHKCITRMSNGCHNVSNNLQVDGLLNALCRIRANITKINITGPLIKHAFPKGQ